MIESLGAQVVVKDYDEYIPDEEILVFGGGPGDINDFSHPKMNKIREILADRDNTPLLGICLGCQAICQHLGINVKKLPEPLQGVQKDVIISRD